MPIGRRGKERLNSHQDVEQGPVIAQGALIALGVWPPQEMPISIMMAMEDEVSENRRCTRFLLSPS